MRKHKSFIRITFTILIVCASVALTKAQHANDIKKIAEEFKHLSTVYKQKASVSYDIKYVYTNESTPGIILDSLSGTVELNGDNYRSVLDSTETIKNKRYVIMLFKEDKVMYLAKPGNKEFLVNPGAVIDSLLSTMPDLQFATEVNEKFKTIRIVFPPAMPYKSISVTIDTSTGFIVKAKYIVKTEQLADTKTSLSDADGAAYDAYAIVEAQFNNYRINTIDANRFDEKTFFKKEGKDFIVTNAYKDYKIFVGTLNL